MSAQMAAEQVGSADPSPVQPLPHIDVSSRQISSFLSNGDIKHSVNFPSVSLPARCATD